MKKGFTLVEVMVTILLITSVSLLAFESASKLKSKNEIKEYENIIKEVINEAEMYGERYLIDVLPVNDNLCTKSVSVLNLMQSGYLVVKDNNLIDPRTNKSLNNLRICLSYDNNQVKGYLEGER